jgi:hypothetical protein
LVAVQFAAMQKVMKGMKVVVTPRSKSAQFPLKLRV